MNRSPSVAVAASGELSVTKSLSNLPSLELSSAPSVRPSIGQSFGPLESSATLSADGVKMAT